MYILFKYMDCSQVEVLTLKARCTTTHLCLGFKEKNALKFELYCSIVLFNPHLCQLNLSRPVHLRYRPSQRVLQGINPNFQYVRNKNRENTYKRKRTIIRTRQYLRSSVICLRPRSCKDFTIIKEKIQSVVVKFFSLSKNYIDKP